MTALEELIQYMDNFHNVKFEEETTSTMTQVAVCHELTGTCIAFFERSLDATTGKMLGEQCIVRTTPEVAASISMLPNVSRFQENGVDWLRVELNSRTSPMFVYGLLDDAAALAKDIRRGRSGAGRQGARCSASHPETAGDV